jgi:hypothetical protein
MEGCEADSSGKDYFAFVGIERTMNVTKTPTWLRLLVCGLGIGMLTAANTGCQVNVAGQTLPSPYYMDDDVQYFAPGPEFKLQREAAAQKAYKEEQALRGLQGQP